MVEFRSLAGTADRLVWLAAGYEKAGDKFHAATDRAWWDRQYRDPKRLWGYLATMADVYDVAHPTAVIPAFRSDMATAAPKAMQEFLDDAYQALVEARAEGLEPPIGVPPLPKVPRPPTIPPGTPVPRPPLPLPGGRPNMAPLIIIGLAILLMRGRRR
jgi:hypothetical protein